MHIFRIKSQFLYNRLNEKHTNKGLTLGPEGMPPGCPVIHKLKEAGMQESASDMYLTTQSPSWCP